jgi:uncharacterized membrane protein
VAAFAEGSVIDCAHPEAFLLVPLVVLLLRGRLWPRPFVGCLRVLLVLAVAAVFAEPSWPGADDGRDIVLVVDGSRSMPDGALARAREYAAAVAGELQPGDRLGALRFGQRPVLDAVPQRPFAWPEVRAVDVDGSDLGAAIAAGLAAIAPGRRGSLLVWSDGEHNGAALDAVVRQAARAGVRIDAWHEARQPGADVAVDAVSMPGEVARGEPFAIAATVLAGTAGPVRWRLLADGEVLREGEASLQVGANVLQFRHALQAAGQHEFAVEVVRPGDAVPQNDRGLATTRVVTPPRVLCVTPRGREDRWTRSLRSAGIEVVVTAPANAPLTAAALDGFRSVVLEDVPANELPQGGMTELMRWVRLAGGGLCMTGGKASFGVGGYHRSPLEEVLPVTMEIREEQRRFGLAMAIALDRSGSMTAPAGGVTKMDLANRGAAAAIELLSAIDSVALLAVDTDAHVVVPMAAVNDRNLLVAKARSIESSGGGIYVGAALHAAAAELVAAPQQNKHIVLFADAADAEEPGDYRTFVPSLVQAGVTVSVIGLGRATDSDGPLLEAIAKLGNGRCQFVEDAVELPRVFAQETIQVARSSVVEAPTAVAQRAGWLALGDMPGAFPEVGGYSLAWLRPRAELALVTTDAQQAPLLAHWQIGLGRAAAVLAEVDGPLSGGLASWDGYGDFATTLVRWLCGGQTTGVFTQAQRQGQSGVFSLEVDDARQALLDTARGVVANPDGSSRDLVWERVAPGRLLAQVPLTQAGVHRAAVQLGGETLRLPPLCLPYSPEFAGQADARAGERTLRALARATGGSLQPGPAEVVHGERRSTGRFDLGPVLAWFAVLLLLAEIAVRRLQVMWPAPRWWQRRQAAKSIEPTPAAASEAVAVRSTAAAASAPPSPPPAATEAPDLLDALSRAKQRRGRR